MSVEVSFDLTLLAVNTVKIPNLGDCSLIIMHSLQRWINSSVDSQTSHGFLL